MARPARPPSSLAGAAPVEGTTGGATERLAMFGALALLAAFAGWVALGSLQQDLAAYVTAARARALGLDPYVNHLLAPGGPWDGVAVYRHSRFLYPPLLADLFRPLAALPYAWGKGLFTLASVAGLGIGLWLARRGAAPEAATPEGASAEAGPGAPLRPLGLGFALLAAALWPPVFVALERGQIDLLLLPLLAVGWRWRRQRPLAAGAALALCALAKPFALLAWPLLLCARRFRLVAWATGWLAALLGLGAVAAGPALARTHLLEVLPRAMLYGEGGPEGWLLSDESLARASARTSVDEIRLDPRGPAFPAELGGFRRNASVVRLLAGEEAPAGPTGAIVLGALGGLLAWAAARRPDDPAWFWGALLAGVAAAPVAWAMSLPLGLPLLFAVPLVSRLTEVRRRPSTVALAIAWGAGAVGPLVPAAWCLAAVAGVAAAALAAQTPAGRTGLAP